MSADTVYSPPMTCLANTYPVKTTSSGKDIAIFCGHTTQEWSPSIAQTKGVGGSEEAVIQLAYRWAAAGWNVTVYNASDREQQYFVDPGSGPAAAVTYRPYWLWNYRDREDIVILWRHPEIAKYPINAGRVILDLHDVGPYNFPPEGLRKIAYVCVKTQAHAAVFPDIPREKLRIIPNGLDPKQFRDSFSKEKNLIVNTSSANRSLSALLDIFEQVKTRMPSARLEWAYGWDIGDALHRNNEFLAWKAKMQARMQALGVIERGKLNSDEVAKLYERGSVFLYPTGFYEIFCISAVKAQYAGAYPITSDFAALNEVVAWGDTIRSDHLTKDSWAKPHQFDFSITTRKNEYADKVVAALERPRPVPESVRENLAMRYSWDKIAEAWYPLFMS